MTPQVQLVLVIHNHQPVGNFDHVFEEACERAYLPFFRTLLDYPAVRIGLHTSGCLWEWVEAKRTEYGELVDALLSAGQLELLGGGMYEPILPVLPHRDALRQLNRLSEFLEQRFGARPKGAWIAERVWEPHLPEVLAEAGLRYCLLDDFHFQGNAPANFIATDYFTTRHAAAEIALLPIARELRYTIPFKPVEETFNHLKAMAESTDQTPLCVFGDDGEKFGIWPDTYEWVYDKGWLRSFFTALTQNQDWIKLMLPREVLSDRKPAGTVFIPSRSYMEMGEWTNLGGDQPGHWRNFLGKYPEARQAYERMIEVSTEVNAAGEQAPPEAWDDLARAQCNCSYWHGVFGGLYLNYLRQAVTQNLLRAERAVMPQISSSTSAAEAHAGNSFRLHNSELSITVEPAHGLAISRLDYYPTLFNWADVLSRRAEPYHARLLQAEHSAHQPRAEQVSIHEIVRVKEQGLARRLLIDPHPRHSFVTYFSQVESPEQFVDASAPVSPVLMTDWHAEASLEQRSTRSVSSRLSNGEMKLRKSVELDGSQVTMKVTASGDFPADHTFYVEFNLTVLTDQSPDRHLVLDGIRFPLDAGHHQQAVTVLELVDEWQQRRILLRPSTPAKLITYPVYTVSSSEAGFERTYQGTCIMLGFNQSAIADGIGLSLRVEEHQ